MPAYVSVIPYYACYPLVEYVTTFSIHDPATDETCNEPPVTNQPPVKGINEPKLEPSYVYPNPASGKAVLDMRGFTQAGIVRVQILDSRGIELQQFSSNSRLIELDTYSLTKGLYLVKANQGSKMIVKKFVKE